MPIVRVSINQLPETGQTSSNNFQQVATTHNMVCKRSQHVGPNIVASCWPTMLRAFARALTNKPRSRFPRLFCPSSNKQVHATWQFQQLLRTHATAYTKRAVILVPQFGNFWPFCLNSLTLCKIPKSSQFCHFWKSSHFSNIRSSF